MNGHLGINADQSPIKIALNKAILLHQNGQIIEAIDAYQAVLALDPANFDALYNVGRAANQIGQMALAENFYNAALSIRADSVDALNDLGLVLMAQENFDKALDCYLKVVTLCPDSPQASFNVATVFYDMSRMQDAMQYCLAALSLQPDFLAAHIRSGMIHYNWDDLHSALESFTKAYHIAPDSKDALSLLAMHKIAQGRPDEALPYLNQALAIAPDDQFANTLMDDATHNMQDNAPVKEKLYNAGLIDEAEEIAREELAKNNSVDNHNFLLKCYLASNKHSALDYFQESRQWSSMHAHEELLPHPSEFKNDRNPNRRIKVGIVGDYFLNVIGVATLYPFFMLYDHKALEIFCYNFGPDEEKIRPIVDQYRDISQLSDDALFKLVREDAIDIMLDINGRIRTPNYFEALLKQPAPIQVNWYNLPCTVGVKAYNYAITDDYCVRKDEENVYVEKIFRMPTGTICAWAMDAPPVSPPPPYIRNGYITYGCFGDFFKVNDAVLSTWAVLLGRVPNSRLYLKSNNLRLISERERVTDFFSQRGIKPERLMLEGISAYNQMKKCYEWMDIGLDTFPYSSGSTTINAIWQGVPVVAIEGNDWRGRSTAAVLAGAGLNQFIGKDKIEYLAIAEALATDTAQLIDFRTNLAKRLLASPQWQIKDFARNFESRLRMIWQDWLRQL